MTIVALASGGLDSSVMMGLMKLEGIDVLPVHVDYGQRSEAQEWKACQAFCTTVGLKDPVRFELPALGQIPSGLTNPRIDVNYAFFPTRNLLLLTIGAAFAYSKNVDTVAIGLIGNAVFPDQTESFRKQAESAIATSVARNLKVVAPLLLLDKGEVMRLARAAALPIDLTYSCHVGNVEPCGVCAACRERKAAQAVPESRDLSKQTREARIQLGTAIRGGHSG